MTIWKYELRCSAQVVIEMPKGAEILCVQTQNDFPRLWARVDPDAPREKRRFAIVGTGHPLGTNPGAYIGSFQLQGGALVFHVFGSSLGAPEKNA